jgi:hypothetical protein
MVASTLSRFESRIETTTARDLRLIQSALQGVIGAIHKRLLSDSPQNPKFTVATIERENTLTQTNYGNPWLQEIPDNITNRLDAAVELTSAAFDHVSHFSAEAAEYRGLNLVPLRKDVEAAHISIKQLQVIMEQRLKTVQEEQADIETNLRQKQGALTQLRSVIAENERTIGIKQSEVRSLLAEGDRLRRAAEQQRSEMAVTTVVCERHASGVTEVPADNLVGWLDCCWIVDSDLSAGGNCGGGRDYSWCGVSTGCSVRIAISRNANLSA